MAVYEKTIDSIVNQKKRNIEGQFSLFDDNASSEIDMSLNDEMPNLPEYNEKMLLAMEKEMVGVYLSGHPLSEYEDELDNRATTNSSELAEVKDQEEENKILRDGSRVVMGGIIIKKQNKITKNNNMMAFITLEDLYGTFEGIIFPKVYESCKDVLYEDSIVLIEGTINAAEDDAPKLICNKITELKKSSTNPAKHKEKKVYIKVADKNHYMKIKNDLFTNISKCSGNDCVIIYSEQEKANMVLPKDCWVNASDKSLINVLKTMLGETNVVVK
jgi:DNA polymerase-3 subunit alpha